jgi:hypothetical protein
MLSHTLSHTAFSTYATDTWTSVTLKVATGGEFSFSASVGAGKLTKCGFTGAAALTDSAVLLERLTFRTGYYRGIDLTDVDPATDLPLAYTSVWSIDNVTTAVQSYSH